MLCESTNGGKTVDSERVRLYERAGLAEEISENMAAATAAGLYECVFLMGRLLLNVLREANRGRTD